MKGRYVTCPSDLQWLFDNGYLVHREDDLSNGKPDFLFSDEDSNPYIIEVKYDK